MPRFTMKLNDTPDHAEHDWLVLDNGQFLAGSNAAERFLTEIEAQARIARTAFRRARAARRAGRI